MAVWIAVLAVGAVTLAVRLLPFLVVERFALPVWAGDTLRHAGTGAITALIVLAALGGRGAGPHAAVLLTVAVGVLLAWRGWSMIRVVLAGACAYAATLGVLALL